jgi:tRNA(Ile)-lysidine synthase
MELTQQFKNYIKQQNLFHPKDKLLLAVSGGLDSAVLCELCKQAGYDFGIAHCNFQLRGTESDGDEHFVEALSKRYAVTFYRVSFDTDAIAAKEKKSIEETARDLRYSWFEELRNTNEYDYIVTAHHANDNIETVLMNFFRGTGIKGLHGILPKQNKIVRPLLFTNKKALELFAAKYQIAFVKDHTNEQNDFTRNYFRNELIPSIQKVFPSAEENILKNISRLGEAEQLYNQAVDVHKKKLMEQKGNEIHIPVLKLQQVAPLGTIIFEIVKHYNFSAHQTEDIIALLKSESGKYVQSSSHRIIKNRKWLIISPNKPGEAQNIIIEAADKEIDFEMGHLQMQQYSTCNIDHSPLVAQLNAGEITFPLLLRKWKPGDYFYPLGMQKKKKLSRFFTDQKLSLTQKENVWVIETNKKIIWVIGMRIDDRFKITGTTKNILQLEFKMLGAGAFLKKF